MIGSTKHSLKFLNLEKSKVLESFCEEYSSVCLNVFHQIWDNGYKKFSIVKECYDLDSKLDYKLFNIETSLSARALQCATNQAGGIVRSVVEKQRRAFWYAEKFSKTPKILVFTKPKIEHVSPQLNANCLDFQIDPHHFEGFAKIKSLGKFASVTLPIYKSSQYNKWKNRGSKLCLSIKIFKKNFQLTWDWERNPSPAGEEVVGLDQGLKTVVTLSDGQSTPNQCPHGHSLESVVEKLARKKKDSKGFKKAQTHRKNFTHWSINQLNFSGLKEVRLEKVVNIRKGRSCSRKMSHWSNPEIRDKIKRRCEELEVPVIEQSCAYRSQRCSACGIVRKANRKGKFYTCKGCKWECDADLNAALNHESDLPDIPFSLLGKKLNLGDGFLWKSDGIFRLDGSELIVPVDQKNNFQ